MAGIDLNSSSNNADAGGNTTSEDVGTPEIKGILNNIAVDMNAIIGLIDYVDAGDNPFAIYHSIRLIAARSGATADRALKDLGETQNVGDFADWMA